MFDREKQLVINKFCDAIFKDKNKITLGNVLALPIPKSIKRFFEEEVDQRFARELNEIKNFSSFNFDLPEIQPSFNQVQILLKANKTFTNNEFSTTLKSALDFTIDYLLRPCDTLTSFVFDYNQTQSSEFIIKKLKYVVDYDYLPEIIRHYFYRTKRDSIGKKEFLALARKADKEFTKDFTLLDHFEYFKAFKSFLSSLDLFITANAEAEAFQIYLADKDQPLLSAFIEEKKIHIVDSRTDFKSFLLSIILPRSEPTLKKEILASSEPEKVSLEFNKESSSQKKYEESLYNKYAVTSDQTHTQVDSPLPEKGTSVKENVLYKKLTEQKEDKKSIYARNLDGLIKKRLRKLAIKKLFGGDEESYSETITFLDKAADWDEASKYLTDLFQQRNIQPYSKAAMKFTEFLYDNIR